MCIEFVYFIFILENIVNFKLGLIFFGVKFIINDVLNYVKCDEIN